MACTVSSLVSSQVPWLVLGPMNLVRSCRESALSDHHISSGPCTIWDPPFEQW